MSEPAPPVPASAREITSAWLRRALASVFPAATFDALERERIGEAYGFASRIYRCRWRHGARRASVVVKLWSFEGEFEGEFESGGDAEVRFYRAIPAPGVRVPRCFYADSDRSKGVAVLVLEDLTGAVQGDDLAPLEGPRADALAAGLARMHATWADRRDLAEHAWLADATGWRRDASWFRPRRRRFLERFGDRTGDATRELLGALERAPALAAERLADAPTSLLHGDLHLDNVLFVADGEPVLLDWSRPAAGPAPLELAALLFRMAPLARFEPLLERYGDVFERSVARPPPRSAWGRWLGGAFLREFATMTCGVARWEPDGPREARLIEATVERAERAARFWRTRDPELFERLL